MTRKEELIREILDSRISGPLQEQVLDGVKGQLLREVITLLFEETFDNVVDDIMEVADEDLLEDILEFYQSALGRKELALGLAIGEICGRHIPLLTLKIHHLVLLGSKD